MSQASDFGPGHDLTVRGFEPHVGLYDDSLETVSDSVSPSLCLCPSLTVSLSLSVKNKETLKNLKKRNKTFVVLSHDMIGSICLSS